MVQGSHTPLGAQSVWRVSTPPFLLPQRSSRFISAERSKSGEPGPNGAAAASFSGCASASGPQLPGSGLRPLQARPGGQPHGSLAHGSAAPRPGSGQDLSAAARAGRGSCTGLAAEPKRKDRGLLYLAPAPTPADAGAAGAAARGSCEVAAEGPPPLARTSGAAPPARPWRSPPREGGRRPSLRRASALGPSGRAPPLLPPSLPGSRPCLPRALFSAWPSDWRRGPRGVLTQTTA